jgi:hypothetical protein
MDSLAPATAAKLRVQVEALCSQLSVRSIETPISARCRSTRSGPCAELAGRELFVA